MDGFDDANAWATTSPSASPRVSLEKPVWAVSPTQEDEPADTAFPAQAAEQSSPAIDKLSLSREPSRDGNAFVDEIEEPESGPSSFKPAPDVIASTADDAEDEFDEFGDFDDAAPNDAAFDSAAGDVDDFDGFEEAPTGAFASEDSGFTDEPQDIWEAPLVSLASPACMRGSFDVRCCRNESP